MQNAVYLAITFQSYLSPIQTRQVDTGHDSRNDFQSYLSPIQTINLITLAYVIMKAFNPTLVQFKLCVDNISLMEIFPSNPTLVQFKLIHFK